MTREMVVMMDSPEAATEQTVTGWVSRDGFFFGKDERTARYAGATHRACEECGKAIEKNWIVCPLCREKKMSEKFTKLDRRKWDGVTPLAIWDTDTYFFSLEDVEQYCEENEVEMLNLCLVFCDPIKPREVDAGDLFHDELPEDGEVQDSDIIAAVDALNKAIRKAQPFSWYPGKVAADLSEVAA